jgi:hypothetical protein
MACIFPNPARWVSPPANRFGISTLFQKPPVPPKQVKNVQQVALEAGKSPAIIFKHYREFDIEKAGGWFAILLFA